MKNYLFLALIMFFSPIQTDRVVNNSLDQIMVLLDDLHIKAPLQYESKIIRKIFRMVFRWRVVSVRLIFVFWQF